MLLGGVVLAYLTNRPEDATWLSGKATRMAAGDSEERGGAKWRQPRARSRHSLVGECGCFASFILGAEYSFLRNQHVAAESDS